MLFKRTLMACAAVAVATTLSTAAFAVGVKQIIDNTTAAGLPMEDMQAGDFAAYAKYAARANGMDQGFSAEEIVGLKKAFDAKHGNATNDASNASDASSLESKMGKKLQTVDEAGEEADDAYDEVDDATTGSKSVKFDEGSNIEEAFDSGDPATAIMPAKDTQEFIDQMGGSGKASQSAGEDVFNDDSDASDSEDEASESSDTASEASDNASEASEAASESSEAASEASTTASQTAGQGAGEAVDDGLDDLFSTGSTAADVGQQIAAKAGQAGDVAGDVAETASSGLASTGGEMAELTSDLL